MEHRNNLKRDRLRPVNNGVVGIAGQCPEAQRTGSEVWTGMAAHRRVGEEGTSVVNCLFYAGSGVFAVLRDVRPDLEDVGFRKGRESVPAHRLAERSWRQESCMAWISRRACAPSISSPRSACK